MEVSSHALALRAGSAGSGSPSAATPTSAWTTWTSTPTSTDYFAAKARLFDGRCRGRGAQPRRPGAAAAAQAGARSPTRRPATRRATWWAVRHRGRRRSASASPRTARTASRARPASALPGRHNVANALLAHRRAGRRRGRPGGRGRAAVAACRGVPGRLERVDGARRRCSAWWTTRTSRTRSWRRWPRCASSPRPRRPADLRASAPAATGTGASGPLMGGGRRARRRPGGGHRRQPAHRGPGRDPRRGARPAPSGRRRRRDRRGRRAGGPRSTRRSRLAGPGDVVALLGKGHERGQEVGGEVLPFDDRVELAARAGRPVRRPARSAVIPLTLGRDRRRRSAAGCVGADPARAGDRPGRVRLPQGAARAGCSSRSPARRSTATTSPAAAIAAGAVAVLGTRPVRGVPTVVVDDRWPRMGRLARAVRGPAARADRRRR